VCLRCRDKGLDCQYDGPEGMSKRQQLYHSLSERQQELEYATGVLHHLQTSSDQQATESLARLRIGETVRSEYFRIHSRNQVPLEYRSDHSPQSESTQEMGEVTLQDIRASSSRNDPTSTLDVQASPSYASEMGQSWDETGGDIRYQPPPSGTAMIDPRLLNDDSSGPQHPQDTSFGQKGQ
jgi:hypothetical protein